MINLLIDALRDYLIKIPEMIVVSSAFLQQRNV